MDLLERARHHAWLTEQGLDDIAKHLGNAHDQLSHGRRGGQPGRGERRREALGRISADYQRARANVSDERKAKGEARIAAMRKPKPGTAMTGPGKATIGGGLNQSIVATTAEVKPDGPKGIHGIPKETAEHVASALKGAGYELPDSVHVSAKYTGYSGRDYNDNDWKEQADRGHGDSLRIALAIIEATGQGKVDPNRLTYAQVPPQLQPDGTVGISTVKGYRRHVESMGLREFVETKLHDTAKAHKQTTEKPRKGDWAIGHRVEIDGTNDGRGRERHTFGLVRVGKVDRDGVVRRTEHVHGGGSGEVTGLYGYGSGGLKRGTTVYKLDGPTAAKLAEHGHSIDWFKVNSLDEVRNLVRGLPDVPAPEAPAKPKRAPKAKAAADAGRA